MRIKILTVDDSKTVRIIVQKAFKSFDCEVVEASNGLEGLAAAAREAPAIILLDVTMPVMDGVEMLTKLKADPQLKSIPVMMLTAEGGRENVMKIAKIGVRDYIVKPFKEEILVDKVGRIVDLQPMVSGPVKVRLLSDPADILVVEDKPAIIQQIQDGLKHTAWKVHGCRTQAEAVEFFAKKAPDLVIMSLSLPQEAAFALFRLVRANAVMKQTPVFGLVIRTDTAAQQAALQLGFSTVITKPIDLAELETRIGKALKIDMSSRYFEQQADVLVFRLPENCSPSVLADAGLYVKAKLSEAVDSGLNKAIIDIRSLKALTPGIVQLVLQAVRTCQDLALGFALAAHPRIASESKDYEGSRTWTFYDTLEDAKANIGKSTPPAVPAAPQLAGV